MHDFSTTRRNFLRGISASAGLLGASCNGVPAGATGDDAFPALADVTLRIAPVRLEIARGVTVDTVGYNGSVPGPVIRFREGVAASVEIFNDTDIPELVHWHGFEIPAEVDGAEEEGSPAVAPHGRLKYRMTPSPAGSRYVHTHSMAMMNLERGTFNGQFAFAWVEPRNNPGRFDQEIFLATHEWGPYFSATDEPEDASPEHAMTVTNGKDDAPHGREVGYRHFTINGKCLGFGDPIRVREGQRVLFHFLNASATESVRLALPGHRFEVVALDGNPTPRHQFVEVLELGTAERIDAVVAMNSPGVFVLGTPNESHRRKGMGIVVEYANRTGKPQWMQPIDSSWDYTVFGENRAIRTYTTPVPLVIRREGADQSGFDQWSINGKRYGAQAEPTRLALGHPYCLVIDNQSDDVHPVHLHRNNFELIEYCGVPTAGIMKDVVQLKNREVVKVGYTPSSRGLALFHCHQQLHMDNGFKMLFDVR